MSARNMHEEKLRETYQAQRACATLQGTGIDRTNTTGCVAYLRSLQHVAAELVVELAHKAAAVLGVVPSGDCLHQLLRAAAKHARDGAFVGAKALHRIEKQGAQHVHVVAQTQRQRMRQVAACLAVDVRLQRLAMSGLVCGLDEVDLVHTAPALAVSAAR